jgi:hypothetical protein
LGELEADEAAADREEGFVDVVAALVADAQPPVLVQPAIVRSTTQRFAPSPEP